MVIRQKRRPNKGWVGSVTSTGSAPSPSASGVALCPVVPQRLLRSADLCRKAGGAGQALRASDMPAGRDPGAGRGGSWWRGRRASAASPDHAGERRHGAAPDPPPAAARAGRVAGRGRGRLGDAPGPDLRHHRGGHGAPACGRPAAGPHRSEGCGVAAAAPRDRGGGPRLLDGAAPRRRCRRAQGGPGRRPLAPAVQRARHAERWLARAHARLRRLPVPPGGDGRQPGQRTRACRRNTTDDAASADICARWLAAYEDVRRRHLAGEKLLAISRSTGLARATVRKHAHAGVFPERAVRPLCQLR